jgi:hypothetical protein
LTSTLKTKLLGTWQNKYQSPAKLPLEALGAEGFCLRSAPFVWFDVWFALCGLMFAT